MEKRKSRVRPTAYILFCLTGWLFVFCCLAGGELAERGNIVWTGRYAAATLAASLAGGCLLGGAVCTLWGLWDGRRRRQETSGLRPLAFWGRQKQGENACGQEAEARRRIHPGMAFAGCLLLTMLAWLPAYLAYYPAICSYDMPVQTGQVAEQYYVDHHPIIHTFLLKCFMNLGETVFGSVTAGIGIFAFLQMAFLAAAFACGVAVLYKNGAGRVLLALVQFWCMFYPFHWYMGVSLTKDTIFTGFFVFSLLALYELLEENEGGARRLGKEICFALAAVGIILFRNNGKYAVLVLLAAFLLVFLFGKGCRRYWGRLLLWGIGAFLAGNVLLSGIFRWSGAEQGDRREMLSMPIQQLARTMLYHGGAGVLPEDDNTMGEPDKALINDFILNEGYKNYDPHISDPVKSNTNTYVARYRAKEFLETYLRLFWEYPGEYLNAALEVNAGYLYPGDVSHAYINVSDDRVGRGYVQTYWEEETMNARGIYKASKWEWLHGKLEQWADENAYLKLSAVKYLFVPGVWLWYYLLLLARLVMKRQYRKCIPLALAGGYFATLLLGPAVQLRYLYPLMAAFPFAALLSGTSERRRPAVAAKRAQQAAGRVRGSAQETGRGEEGAAGGGPRQREGAAGDGNAGEGRNGGRTGEQRLGRSGAGESAAKPEERQG